MAEIRWTEEAHRWLLDIFTYIAADDPAAAQGVVTGIYEKVQLLRRFPELGYRYRTEDITVLGVFHGALDIEKYLT